MKIDITKPSFILMVKKTLHPLVLDQSIMQTQDGILLLGIEMDTPGPAPLLIIKQYDDRILVDIRRIHFFGRTSPLVQLNHAQEKSFTFEGGLKPFTDAEAFTEFGKDSWAFMAGQISRGIADGTNQWDIVHYLCMLHVNEVTGCDPALRLIFSTGELYLSAVRDHRLLQSEEDVCELIRSCVTGYQLVLQFHQFCREFLIPAPFRPAEMRPSEAKEKEKKEQASESDEMEI